MNWNPKYSSIQTIALTKALSVALMTSITLLACQPAPNTPIEDNVIILGGEGEVAAKFDVGQTLNPADFSAIGGRSNASQELFSLQSFKVLQASPVNSSPGFNIADIDKAVITITSPHVQTPAEVTLTKSDIANGWSFLFKGIPVGQANVTLKVFDGGNNLLFSDSQNVTVSKDLTTPVDFVLELNGSSSGCFGSSCTGNIKVSVRAVTACRGQVSVLPVIGKVGESVVINVKDLEGSMSEYLVDFGDGSSPQSVNSLPLTHTYSKEGRYSVTMTLKGSGCKNDYVTQGYVSVEAKLTPTGPSAGKIVFTSLRDNRNGDIFVMDENGANQVNLTNSLESDNYPSLSHDGTQICYSTLHDGSLYTMNIDGSNKRKVLTDKQNGYACSWSPDGKQLAMGVSEISIVNVDGTNLRVLGAGGAPRWSSNNQITFSEINSSGLDSNIYIMDVNGQNIKTIAKGVLSNWSPDGQQLIYEDEKKLWKIDSSGGVPELISNIQSSFSNPHFMAPVWSKSNKIFLGLLINNNSDIYSINADGSNLQRLTSHPSRDALY